MDIDPTYTLNVTIWNAEKKSGWYAIASPVEGQTFATTNHLTSKAKHNIYRYNGTKKEYVYKGTTLTTAAKPTQYVDKSLTAGTTYYYKVMAVNKTADYTLTGALSAAAAPGS